MSLTQPNRYEVDEMTLKAMTQLDAEARSHATSGGMCKRRRDKTPSRKRERLRAGLRILDLSRPNRRVTHRHIPGVFGRFFQVNAVFSPVTHPHVNCISGCETGTSP